MLNDKIGCLRDHSTLLDKKIAVEGNSRGNADSIFELPVDLGAHYIAAILPLRTNQVINLVIMRVYSSLSLPITALPVALKLMPALERSANRQDIAAMIFERERCATADRALADA